MFLQRLHLHLLYRPRIRSCVASNCSWFELCFVLLGFGWHSTNGSLYVSCSPSLSDVMRSHPGRPHTARGMVRPPTLQERPLMYVSVRVAVVTKSLTHGVKVLSSSLCWEARAATFVLTRTVKLREQFLRIKLAWWVV